MINIETIKNKIIKIIDLIIKYRYLIAFIIFVILVVCKINFSSVDMWGNYVQGDSGVIYGAPRSIRSDEWLVQTPYSIAQTEAKGYYEIYNQHIGQGTNMILGEAPAFDLITLPRILQWGYLLFGAEYGFSWYWALKTIMLFMVSFELSRILSKKDRLLSITGAVWITFMASFMWWFSTAIVDAYIYGFAIVVLFYYYMENLNYTLKRKILIALGIALAIPAFTYVLYPAIQVPYALIMVVFVINGFAVHWKEVKKQDFILIGVTILVSALFILRFVLISWNDILIMMGTVYPGSRFETGGGIWVEDITKGFLNILLPYSDILQNPSEASWAYFPAIAIIITIIFNLNNIKQKIKNKENWLLIGLVLVFALLGTYIFVGLPKVLARITFLYFSPAKRVQVVYGLLGIMISIAIMKKMASKEKKMYNLLQRIAIAIIVTILACIVIKNSSFWNANIITTKKMLFILALEFLLTYLFVSANKKAFCIYIIVISIITGATVNPIVRGIGILTKTEFSNVIQKEVEKDYDSLWIASTNIYAQYLIANGANTLNGVNRYPNFKWLEKVDPEKKFAEVYNRYAHISIELGDEINFELEALDSYKATLTYNALKELGVKYYFTNSKPETKIIEKFHLEEIYNNSIEHHLYIVK